MHRWKDAAHQSLEESIAEVPLSPVDLCSYLYLEEHHRRYTVASLELFRTLFEVRLPFVDADFLTVLLRAPAPWRDGTAIHQAIIGTNHPAMLRVRNSNTGAPGSAGPFLETVFDKINSLGRRLNLYGYRHYHDFERWMQQMLVESVEKVLLSPDSLSRGVYREVTLRRLLEETKTGHRRSWLSPADSAYPGTLAAGESVTTCASAQLSIQQHCPATRLLLMSSLRIVFSA